jgi:hypothetical protein
LEAAADGFPQADAAPIAAANSRKDRLVGFPAGLTPFTLRGRVLFDMTILDLVFLLSALLVLLSAGSMTVYALRRKWASAKRLALGLAVFLGCYAIGLVGVSLASPRRTYQPGERRCYDEWCVAVAGIRGGGSGVWVADVEVSSQARRIRQRAPDARAQLEDETGRRYEPVDLPGSARLTDYLGPGESFHALPSFRLPAGARPAGLILHHGDFPGVVIIGDDSSFLHRRALMLFPPAAATPLS